MIVRMLVWYRVFGIEYMVYRRWYIQDKDATKTCMLVSPLYWALEPESEILVFLCSVGRLLQVGSLTLPISDMGVSKNQGLQHRPQIVGLLFYRTPTKRASNLQKQPYMPDWSFSRLLAFVACADVAPAFIAELMDPKSSISPNQGV